MFGCFRIFLAMCVVASHLGGISLVGVYAVFGFYCLSGYLMTLIAQSIYGYTRSGFFKYSLNRFLRIYPIYWVSIAISTVLVIWLGEDWTKSYHRAIYIPESIWGMLKNMALFFPLREFPRLTPPAWALTVEIFFYILIGLGASKSKATTLIWFSISLTYHAVALVTGLGLESRYYNIAAASLPFSTGALIWHFSNKLNSIMSKDQRNRKHYLPVYGAILMVLNWLAGIALWKIWGINLMGSLFFYTNYIICAAMVIILMNRSELPWLKSRTDKILGDFSYPIYLIHYQSGIISIIVLGSAGVSIARPSIELLVATIPLLLLASYIIIVFLERPIDTIRMRVKS
jgi:peptidoglycan/LPS O-acetylase OafA/YrhL